MSQHREGGFLVTKIHHLSGRIFAEKLRKHQIEINPGQGRILYALWREDGIPINELARRTLLSKSTLTTMLDRLEDAGLLSRVPTKSDRRKTLIRLTEKVKALEDTYAGVSEEMTELFYRDFRGEEIDQFEKYLGRILRNLTDYEA
jgi:DNA-binding MarR family transcriptional regulator